MKIMRFEKKNTSEIFFKKVKEYNKDIKYYI